MSAPDSTLAAVLDTLLPGDGAAWPAAGTHGLAARTRELAPLFPGAAEAIDRVLAALPHGFADAPPDAREATLQAREAADPDGFAALVAAAYTAYYTDPRVRAAVEARTGYPNRPPQPLGYDLAPFDESLLEPVRARGPIWRPVPEE